MGHRSEEGLIENTRWAQWSVCRAITHTCYRVSFWSWSLIQITARPAGANSKSKSQGIQYRLGLIVYDIVAVKIFPQYCNIALLIRAIINLWLTYLLRCLCVQLATRMIMIGKLFSRATPDGLQTKSAFRSARRAPKKIRTWRRLVWWNTFVNRVITLTHFMTWWLQWQSSFIGFLITRPIESHNGARETILVGPYHNFRTCWEQGTEKEETWGGVSPHHPTRGLGERRKLFQRGPGCRKWIFSIFEVSEKPSGIPFSVFLNDGRASKTLRGLGKLPPSRRACSLHLLYKSIKILETVNLIYASDREVAGSTRAAALFGQQPWQVVHT